METQINKETQALPQLTPLDTGEQVKAFQVTGRKEMIMPDHHSTEEAVVVVLEGAAELRFTDGNHSLSKGGTFLIPGGKPHKLVLLEDFRAMVVMPMESKIEFEKS